MSIIYQTTLFDDSLILYDDARVGFDCSYIIIGEVGGPGSSRPKKRPSYEKKFIVRYDVIGYKRFIKLFVYQIKGILKFFLNIEFTVFSIIKNIISFNKNLLGSIKEKITNQFNLTGTSKQYYLTNSTIQGTRIERFLNDEIIIGNRKEVYKQSHLTIASLLSLLEQTFRVHRKIELNKNSFIQGNLKVEKQQRQEVIGKKDISNLLELLDIFD